MALWTVALMTVAGCTGYRQRAELGRPGFRERGVASWYGPGFHGRLTASGEVYDMDGLTAAHKKLPFDTVVEVLNRDNGRAVRVRINDRGPFVRGRIIDLSRGAARAIDMVGAGIAQVTLTVVSSPDSSPQARARQWIVQAGAFSDRVRAEQHLLRVAEIDRRAELSSDAGMHRIVIGPFGRDKEARRIAASLERRGIAAFVRRQD